MSHIAHHRGPRGSTGRQAWRTRPDTGMGLDGDAQAQAVGPQCQGRCLKVCTGHRPKILVLTRSGARLPTGEGVVLACPSRCGSPALAGVQTRLRESVCGLPPAESGMV